MTRIRTTIYVTLLSVVLALALTAAGPAPTGPRPPQRRRRPPPHGRLPRQGQGPRPPPPIRLYLRLPQRPPAASGSAQTDREALVALYNATDGPNWTDKTITG